MNLVERARDWHPNKQIASNRTHDLLIEMAGEVERLWAFEKEFKEVILPAWNATRDNMHENLRKTRVEFEAEVAELKAKTDTEGMMRQWLNGYKIAVSQLQPILFNLLRAADSLGPEPTEDHHHE